MMPPYKLHLKNERRDTYKTFLLFFIILHLVVLAAQGLPPKPSYHILVSWITVILVILLIAFAKSLFGKFSQPYPMVAGLAILASGYAALSAWWLAAAVLLAGLLFLVARRELIVEISQDRIIYPSFPKKVIGWDQLNNVVLKDGMLTIDFKDNRLAQAEIASEEPDGFYEEEFNEFCRRQLKK